MGACCTVPNRPVVDAGVTYTSTVSSRSASLKHHADSCRPEQRSLPSSLPSAPSSSQPPSVRSEEFIEISISDSTAPKPQTASLHQNYKLKRFVLPAMKSLVSELHTAHNGDMFTWEIESLLGKGATGVVFSVRNQYDQVAAIKVVPTESRIEAANRSVRRELSSISRIPYHPNVLKMFGAAKDRHNWYIVSELCSTGDMRTVYRKLGVLPPTCVALLTRDVLNGLQCIHGQKVIHRDLKGANVFIDRTGVAKLGDFGSSAVLSGTSRNTAVGTPYWMAPEVLLQRKHRDTADIWSVGCLVLELLTGRTPFRSIAPTIKDLQTFLSNYDFSDVIAREGVTDPAATQFLRLCLQIDPLHRASINGLLRSDFITRLNTISATEVTKMRNAFADAAQCLPTNAMFDESNASGVLSHALTATQASSEGTVSGEEDPRCQTI